MAISAASAVAGTDGGAPPPEQSASRIVSRTVPGSHTVTIDGFSQIEEGTNWYGFGRKTAKSATFTVAGHSWYTQFIRYIAGGSIDLFLHLHCACTRYSGGGDDGEEGKVWASYAFTLLDDDAGDGQRRRRRRRLSYTVSGDKVCKFTKTDWSPGITIAESQAAPYLHGGDRLRVRCDVTVYTEPSCEDRAVPSRLVPVPPPDMGDHFGRLLATGVGADLTFDVAGETFAAHRYILNARSPVLVEEIISGVTTSNHIGGGVEARVFNALLHYIYTDSLPEIDEGEAVDMARRLIAAADRYRLDRLKLICEDMLCRRVDTSTVVATLVLAEEYKCHGLKKACVQFVMSGSNLKDAMADDGFEHLRRCCPSVLKELLAMVDRH